MSDSAPGKPSVLPRIILVAVVVAVFAGIYVRWGDTLTLAGLAEKETQLRELQQQYQMTQQQLQNMCRMHRGNWKC